jgi:filamentous hemagglutinin family protein
MRASQPRNETRRRPRRDLLIRTALCGALGSLALAAASPAFAQCRTCDFVPPPPPPPPPPTLPVFSSSQVNAGGSLPAVNVAGGSAMTVDLAAPRTLIDWSSFNVAGGNSVTFNFGARNWIVLNRINDAGVDTISGSVRGVVNGAYGGNIWFSSRNGLIFGPGASVDAGGLLVTVSAPNISQFLDPTNFAIDFSGEEIALNDQIQIGAGATLTGHGGLVALIAANITSDAGSGVIGQAGSNVLYGVAESYTVRLTQTAQGDLDLVDFIVPDVGSGSREAVGLDLQNITSANSIFVAAVSRTGLASAVINLEGMMIAQSATAQGGDIILSGGGGIIGQQLSPTVGGAKPTDFYLNSLNASRDIQLKNVGLTLAQPWVRPPPPPPPEPDPLPPDCGDFCNGGDVVRAPLLDLGGGGGGPQTRHAVDAGFVSTLTAGRDIKLASAQEIDLGTATAGRDVLFDAAALLANSVTGGRTTSITAENGLLHVAKLTFSGDTTLASKNGSAEIDAIGFAQGPSQTLTVNASTNATLGDGTGDVGGGVINLVAGGDAIINVGGAAKVANVTAGGQATLHAGALTVGAVKARNILATGGSVGVDQATAAGDVYIISSAGDASANNVTAGDDVYVRATGGTASLANATLTGLAPDVVGLAFPGNPDTAANGRVVSVQSTDLDAKLGLGGGAISGASAVSVQAGQDAFVAFAGQLPANLSVTAGRDASLQAATVSFNGVTAGRDVTLNATAGDITVTQDLNAVRNISLTASGVLSVQNVTANNGSIALIGKSVTAGALVAGQDLTLQALSGGVQAASFRTGRDLIVQGATLSLGGSLAGIGRDLSITTSGDFNAASDVSAGRNLALVVGGSANLKGVSAQQTVTLDVQGRVQVGAVSGGDVHIVASDLTLAGALTATTAEIESRTGAFRLGGSSADGAPASGLWLDAAEFGRIHASQSLSLYAGPTQGSARGDLTVLNLDIDPAATPLVNLLAGGGRNVLVQGTAAPIASGGAIRIGDVTNTAWQPNSILVSGALGAATFAGGGYTNIRDFNDVRLHATQDIIMGSPRFIALIQATAVPDIDLGRNRPLGVEPTSTEQNHVFISAGRLELSAAGKVVNQPTSLDPTQTVGLFLTNKANPQLVIDPPQLVDIFGAFKDPQGGVVGSFQAGQGVTFAVVDANGNPTTPAQGATYRFNSCQVGTQDCTAAAQITVNANQTNPVTTTGAPDGLGDLGGPEDESAKSQAGRPVRPPLLAAAPKEPDAPLAEPVTAGAGSEEIWRKPEAKP